MKVVTCAVLIREHRVFVARRAENQKNAGMWEFPGGKVEAGEKDEDCLEREMREEFGITGRAGAHITDSRWTYKDAEILLRAYYYTWDGGEMSLSVHDECKWADKEMLKTLDFSAADVPIARVVGDIL